MQAVVPPNKQGRSRSVVLVGGRRQGAWVLPYKGIEDGAAFLEHTLLLDPGLTRAGPPGALSSHRIQVALEVGTWLQVISVEALAYVSKGAPTAPTGLHLRNQQQCQTPGFFDKERVEETALYRRLDAPDPARIKPLTRHIGFYNTWAKTKMPNGRLMVKKPWGMKPIKLRNRKWLKKGAKRIKMPVRV
jgi:hypothetical protein